MIAQQACSHGWDDDGVRLSVVGTLAAGSHPPRAAIHPSLLEWRGGGGGQGMARQTNSKINTVAALPSVCVCLAVWL